MATDLRSALGACPTEYTPRRAGSAKLRPRTKKPEWGFFFLQKRAIVVQTAVMENTSGCEGARIGTNMRSA